MNVCYFWKGSCLRIQATVCMGQIQRIEWGLQVFHCTQRQSWIFMKFCMKPFVLANAKLYFISKVGLSEQAMLQLCRHSPVRSRDISDSYQLKNTLYLYYREQVHVSRVCVLSRSREFIFQNSIILHKGTPESLNLKNDIGFLIC